MKLMTRLKIFFGKTAEQVLPVNDMDKLEHAYDKISTNLSEMKDKLYKAKAVRDNYNKELNTNTTLLEKLMVASKKAKAENDTEFLKKAHDHSIFLKGNIERYSMFTAEQSKIVNAFEQRVEVLDKKVQEVRMVLETARLKHEFAENVKEFGAVGSGNIADIDVDAVLKNIDINYDASTYKIEDSKQEEDILKKYDNKESYNDFLAELG